MTPSESGEALVGTLSPATPKSRPARQGPNPREMLRERLRMSQTKRLERQTSKEALGTAVAEEESEAEKER
jgi:hypothetical protein